jgi:hypothetical protein
MPPWARLGASTVQFCVAFDRVVKRWKARVSDAAFIKCGWLSAANIVNLKQCSPAEVQAGLVELEAKQRQAKKKLRLNAAHDFSGTPVDQQVWQSGAALSEVIVIAESDDEVPQKKSKTTNPVSAKMAFDKVSCSKEKLPVLVAALAEQEAKKKRTKAVGDKAQRVGEILAARKAGLPDPVTGYGSSGIQRPSAETGGASAGSVQSGLPGALSSIGLAERQGPALEPKKTCKPSVESGGASAGSVQSRLPGALSSIGLAERQGPAPEPKKKCKPSHLQDDPTLWARFLQRALNAPESSIFTAAYVAEYDVMRSEWVRRITQRSTNSSLGDYLFAHLEQIKSLPQLTKNALSLKIFEDFSESNEVDQQSVEDLKKVLRNNWTVSFQ